MSQNNQRKHYHIHAPYQHPQQQQQQHQQQQQQAHHHGHHLTPAQQQHQQWYSQQHYQHGLHIRDSRHIQHPPHHPHHHHAQQQQQQPHHTMSPHMFTSGYAGMPASGGVVSASAGGVGGGSGNGAGSRVGVTSTAHNTSTIGPTTHNLPATTSSAHHYSSALSAAGASGGGNANNSASGGSYVARNRMFDLEMLTQSQQHAQHSAASSAHSHSLLSSGSSNGRTGFDAYSHNSLYAQQNQRHLLAAGSSHHHLATAAHHSAAHTLHPLHHPQQPHHPHQQPQAALHHHQHQHQQQQQHQQHYYHHAQQQQTPLHRPHTQVMPPMLQHIKSEPVEQITVTPSIQTEEIIIKSEPPDDISYHHKSAPQIENNTFRLEEKHKQHERQTEHQHQQHHRHQHNQQQHLHPHPHQQEQQHQHQQQQRVQLQQQLHDQQQQQKQHQQPQPQLVKIKQELLYHHPQNEHTSHNEDVSQQTQQLKNSENFTTMQPPAAPPTAALAAADDKQKQQQQQEEPQISLTNIKTEAKPLNFPRRKLQTERSSTLPICQRCKQVFLKRQNYTQHVALSTCNIVEYDFKCSVCPMSFMSNEELQAHEQLHRLNRYFCQKYCGKFYETIDECEQHEYDQHEYEMFKCNICCISVTERHQLQVHLNEHKYQPRFDCCICRLCFQTALELHDHYMSNEDFCGKFYDKEAFKKPNTSLTSPYLRKPGNSNLEIANTFSLKDIPPANQNQCLEALYAKPSTSTKTSMEPPQTPKTPSSSSFGTPANDFAILEPQVEVKTEIKVEPDFYPPMDQSDYPNYDNDYSTPDYASASNQNFSFPHDYQDNASSSTNSSFSFNNNDAVQDEDAVCCVPKCGVNKFSSPSLQFFGFPKEEKYLSQWLHNLKMQYDPNINYSLYRICSLHFPKRCVAKYSLSYWAVPTFNLGHDDVGNLYQNRESSGGFPGGEMAKCSMPGCPSQRGETNVKFHVFPRDLKTLIKWCQNSRLPVHSKDNRFFCSRHFEEKCFGKFRLKPWAIPTLNLGTVYGKIHDNPNIYQEEKKCFLPFCRRSRSYDCNLSLYRFPRDETLLRRWCYNLRLDPNMFRGKNHKICSSHFIKEALGLRKLNPGAVPTLNLGHNDRFNIYENELYTPPPPPPPPQPSTSLKAHKLAQLFKQERGTSSASSSAHIYEGVFMSSMHQKFSASAANSNSNTNNPDLGDFCLVPSCKRNRHSDNVTLHTVPKRAEQLKKWCHNLKMDLHKMHKSVRICSAHFEKYCIGGCMRPFAVPTLELGHEDANIYRNPDVIKKLNIRETCCVKVCKRNRDRDHANLHRFPTNPELMQKWCENLHKPVPDGTKLFNDAVCEVHFEDRCLRNKRLEKWAIPTINLGWEDVPHKLPSEEEINESWVKPFAPNNGDEQGECCVASCKRNPQIDDVKLYRPPEDAEQLVKWAHNLQVDVTELHNLKICNLHFEQHCIGKRLLNWAMPTLNLGGKVEHLFENPPPMPAIYKKKMKPDRISSSNQEIHKWSPRCCLPHCRKMRSVDNVHLFRFPYINRQTLAKWCHNLQLPLVGSSHRRICSTHFEPSVLTKRCPMTLAVPTLDLNAPLGYKIYQNPARLKQIKIGAQRHCIIESCRKTKLDGVSLFRFPNNRSMLYKWRHNIKNWPKGKFNSLMRICSEHFEPHSVGVKRLSPGAIPTLKLGHEGKDLYANETRSYFDLEKCIVSGCDSRKDMEDIRLFRFPRDDDELLKKWCNNLAMNPNDCVGIKICSKHFEPDCFGPRQLFKWSIPTLKLGHKEDDLVEIINNPPPEQRSGETLFKCCVPSCGKTRKYDEAQMNSFPKNFKLFRKWKHNLKLDFLNFKEREKYKICNDHFEPVCVGKTRLNFGALPTLNLGHEDLDDLYQINPERIRPNLFIRQKDVERMERRRLLQEDNTAQFEGNDLDDHNLDSLNLEPSDVKCCVNECSAPKTIMREPYDIPESKELRQLWSKEFAYTEEETLLNEAKICGLHFQMIFKKLKAQMLDMTEENEELKLDYNKLQYNYQKADISLVINSYQCRVEDCPTDLLNSNIRLYFFPYGKNLVSKWSHNTGIIPDEHRRYMNKVCALHFESFCITENQRLRSWAIPTLNLPTSSESKHLYKNPDLTKLDKRMLGPQIIKCAVNNCKYLELVEKESLKLFNFPSDDKLLKKWCENLKISHYLTPLLKICSLHFEKNCFGSCRIRSWAIPTLNLGHDQTPEHLNKSTIRKEVFDAAEEISEVQLKQVKIKKSLDTTKCVIPTCRKSRLKHGVRFYSLPSNVNMKRKWLHNLQIKHLKPNQKHHNIKICNLHFHKRCLDGKLIKSWAVPTMHLGHNEAVYDNPRPLRAMTNLRCILTHCKNHTSNKAVRLFVFPKSLEFLEKWSKNLKLETEKCKGRICYEHFEKGVVGHKKLISGAVPTLNLGHEDLEIFNNKELLKKAESKQKEVQKTKEANKVKIVADDCEEDFINQTEDEEDELWESQEEEEEGEEEEEELEEEEDEEDEENIFYDDREEEEQEEEEEEGNELHDELDKADPQPDDDASSVTNSVSDWSSIKFKELRVALKPLTPEDLMDLCSRSSYEKEFGSLKGRRSITPASISKDLPSETPEQKSYFSICHTPEIGDKNNSFKYLNETRPLTPEQIMDNFREPKSNERKSLSPQDPLAQNCEDFNSKTNRQIESLVFCKKNEIDIDGNTKNLKRESSHFHNETAKRERIEFAAEETTYTSLHNETEANNQTNLRTDKALNAVAPICCLKHCGKEKTPEQHLTTFGFPKDPQLLQKWCDNLGLQPEECIGRVCIDHFELRVMGSRRLRLGAVPTLNLGPNRLAKHTNNLEETPQKKSVAKDFNETGKMQEADSSLKPPPPYKLPKPSKQSVFRLCCLKHCRRKKFLKQEQKKQQQLNPKQPETMEILFKFPKDENLRKKWFKNLRLPETLSIKRDLFICSQHFDEKVINNGKLLPFAVPTLQLSYSNRPAIYSNKPKKLKSKTKLTKCFLPHCANKETDHIFLIPFPEHELINLRKWCRNLKLKYQPSKYKTAKICNEHFEPYCFFKRRHLRAGAIPTLNLGHSEPPIRNCRKLRLMRELIKVEEKCCLKDCQATNLKLYGFPRSSELRKIWCNNVQIELSLVLNNHYKICSKHFSADSFIQGSENLKLQAVPNLNLNKTVENPVLLANNSDNSKCIVGNCQKTTSVDKVKLFKFPEQPDILKKWLFNLSLSLETLKPQDVICSKHFDKSCIKNGTLHEKAIPTQFLEVTAKGWLYKNNEDLYEVVHKCCVLNCQITSQEAKHLYRFPKHKEDLDKWLYNLKLPQMEDSDVKDLRVCDKHFEQSCKISNKDLLTQALPTLNLGHNGTDIYGNNFIKCCLNNCTIEGFYYHKLPEDLMLQSFWFQELEMECSYNSSLYICSVHFVSFFERILEKYSAFLKESKEYVKLSVTYNELKALPTLQCFKCHVSKCNSGFKLIWKLFKFPRDKTLFNKWLHNCGLQFEHEERLQYRICAQHFEERCLSEKKLHRWSLPTLKLPFNNSLYVNPPEALPSHHEHLKHCCVSNCPTDKGPFYKFPQKSVEQKKWIQNLDLGNQQCTLNLRVCYKHFENYCFAKAVNKIKPLKSWSVPTLRLKRKSELYLNPADKIAFYVCCIDTCKQILNKSKEIYLFKFPFSNTLKQKWLHNLNLCKQDYKENMRICSLHFEMHCFYKGFKVLRKHSVPTLGLTIQPAELYINPIRRPYFKCCVKLCKAPWQKLLIFPKEKPLLRKWCHNLQLDKEIKLETLRDWKICARHFEQNCFNNNGSIRKLAVPTLRLGHHKKLFKNPEFKAITKLKTESNTAIKEDSVLREEEVNTTDLVDVCTQEDNKKNVNIVKSLSSLKALRKSKVVNIRKPVRKNMIKKKNPQKPMQYGKKEVKESAKAGKEEHDLEATEEGREEIKERTEEDKEEEFKERRKEYGKEECINESEGREQKEKREQCKEVKKEKRKEVIADVVLEDNASQSDHLFATEEQKGEEGVTTKKEIFEESANFSFTDDHKKLDPILQEDAYLENLLEILTESLPENENLKETPSQNAFKQEILSTITNLQQTSIIPREEINNSEGMIENKEKNPDEENRENQAITCYDGKKDILEERSPERMGYNEQKKDNEGNLNCREKRVKETERCHEEKTGNEEQSNYALQESNVEECDIKVKINEEENNEENSLFTIYEIKQEKHDNNSQTAQDYLEARPDYEPSEHSDTEMTEEEIEKCINSKGKHLIACCIKSCPNYGHLKSDLTLFKLPVIHELSAHWLTNCKLSQYSAKNILKRLKICIEHFDKCCIRDNNRLIFGAVPTLNLSSKLDCKKSLNKFKHLRCRIQSCQRSAQYDHINRITFPTGAMKRKWCLNMNLKETDITADDWICHRHFVRKSLIDGRKLKAGVLPTLLPETMGDFDRKEKENEKKFKKNSFKVVKQYCLYPCCKTKPQVLYEWPSEGAFGIIWLVIQKYGSQIEDNYNNCMKYFEQLLADNKLQNNLQALAHKNIKFCGEHFYQLYKTHQHVLQDYKTTEAYESLKEKLQNTFDFLNSLEKVYTKQCCVQQCKTDQNLKSGKTIKLFPFPLETEVAKKWCHNIGLDYETLESKPFLKVCEKHFEIYCLQRRNLLEWALPTLNLPATLDPQDIKQNDNAKVLAMKEKCCIRNCPSHESNGIDLKFYKFPKDPLMQQKWRELTDCEPLNEEPHLCSLHFQAKDFLLATSQLKKQALPVFYLPTEAENLAISSPNNSNIDELIQVKQELDISEEWCLTPQENKIFSTTDNSSKHLNQDNLLDLKFKDISKDNEMQQLIEIKQEILEIQEEEPQTQDTIPPLLTINKFESSLATESHPYSLQNNPAIQNHLPPSLGFVITDIKSQIHLCCVQKCTNSSETKGIHMFNQFPQDSEIFIKWCFNLKIDPRNYKDNQYSICEQHFEAICLTADKQLHPWSVPTLNLNLLENSFIHENDIPDYLKPSQEQCIVYGCINPLKPLYKFPYQPDISLKWFANLKLDYTDFRSQNYRICRRHFTPICFELNDNNKLTSEAVPTQYLGHTDKISYFNTWAEEQQLLQAAEGLNGILRNQQQQDNSRGSSQGSLARVISPHDLEDHDSSYFEDFEEYYGQDD